MADINNKAAHKVSLPLQFAPGNDARVDFDKSYIDLAGVRTKFLVFEMRLDNSHKTFVMAVKSAIMESFMEAHVRAFEFFGGVLQRLTDGFLSMGAVRVGTRKDRELTK